MTYKSLKHYWTLAIAACLVSGSMFTGVSPSVAAQDISPQQLEQLRRLSPAQKQQLKNVLDGGSTSAQSDGKLQEVGPLVVPIDPVEQAQESDPLFQRMMPNDSIIIDLVMKDEDAILLEDVATALGKNVYQLNNRGYLNVPGVGDVLLSGLNPEEAMLRLMAEPALRQLNISVYRLPLTPVGSIALKPFGHDLFDGAPTTFAPATDIPIPVNYTVGPGDVLSLLIFGQHNADYKLVISRDGTITIPEIGPIAVAGMRFDQLREEISKRIEERYIGVSTSLTMGELRSIRVFVLGDVNRPGSYTISSLSTMTNALFVSGGISLGGSLRNVQLKRSNRVVGDLDVYELLLKGNTKSDRRLQPGDVIYVPPVGGQVSVFGQVNRPAIYELRGESSLQELLRLAGGLLPSAYQQEVRIERFTQAGEKSVVVADVSQGFHQNIQPGDQVEVQGALLELSDGVFVKGHVKREGVQQWQSGMRLLDVLPSAQLFQVQADHEYVLVRREFADTGRVQLVTTNWRKAHANPASEDNIVLQKRDTVYVFSLSADRAARIAPLVAEIEAQASHAHPAETVTVQGRVRAPGEYPFHNTMRVSDLLIAAGSTRDNAHLEQAEVTRVQKSGSNRSTAHVSVDLSALVPGSEEDIVLYPDDVLTIKQIPLWREHQNVELVGEFAFPGRYSASRGERLSEVIRRAGGLTEMAFLNGSVFLREDLKEREETQLKKLADRVRTEVLSLDDSQPQAMNRANALLEQLESSEAVGRLVIDLNLAMNGDPEHDVILEDGDQLIVPAKSQEVTVIGEVQYPTSHIYEGNLDQYSYIYKSGGVTVNADSKRIYVIRADGQVIAQQGSRWFRRSGRAIETLPGDTIVVPFDSDHISNLSLWTSVTQIVYNIGVAAAAVASFK